MDNIILQLLTLIQYLYQQNCWLTLFICKYIPLKQWAFDDSHSPEYQKFKVDEPPIIIKREKFDYKELIEYFYKRYHKLIKPIVRKSSKCNVLADTVCPRCGATHEYIYDNNGGKGQFLCAVCSHTFSSDEPKMVTIKCPHCGHVLTVVKERSIFRIHKCINTKCPYYLSRKKELPKGLSEEELLREFEQLSAGEQQSLQREKVCYL